MIIVIDGPAGSGKSSTARAVANRMDLEYLDSGALYRAVTLLFLRNEQPLESFFRNLTPNRIRFRYEDEIFHVWLDDEEVTDRLRSAEVSNNVSMVAEKREVREFVNSLMRQTVRNGIYIAEGRDLGTAVFPDADLKFFMTADVDTRARRRYNELKENGRKVDYQRVRKNIESRDVQDAQRSKDPLKKADDAISIDTSEKSFEQQVDKICSYISRYLK